MSTKPRGSTSVERLQAENDFLRRGGIAEEVGKSIRVLLICAAAVAITYLLGHAIESLSGKETDANIIVSLGRSQMKLRKATIERLHGRIKSLEEGIDPGRTTSKLTKSGDTNPGDT